MIKATLLLLGISLIALFSANASVPNNVQSRTSHVLYEGPQRISLEAAPVVQQVAEVVISVPQPKALQTAHKEVQPQWVCGRVEASQVGGEYRRCEWM
jgi:hypothetical protein